MDFSSGGGVPKNLNVQVNIDFNGPNVQNVENIINARHQNVGILSVSTTHKKAWRNVSRAIQNDS